MSWFKKLIGKKDAGAGSNAAAPPLPPRAQSGPVGGAGHSAGSSSGAAASGASISAPYVADPRSLVVESLMADYSKAQDTPQGANQKIIQLLDLMMPHGVAVTQPAPPAAMGQHKGSNAAAPAPTLGAGMSDEATKRNPHLLFFLTVCAGRLADRIHQFVQPSTVGAVAGTLRGSIGNAGAGAQSSLAAATADKQAARLLGLLHLLNPFRAPTDAEPYGARVLELLRLLSAHDEKRISSLNSGRLTTGLLQALHTLAEMQPSTLEHMSILEKKQAGEENDDSRAKIGRRGGRHRQLRRSNSYSPSQSEMSGQHGGGFEEDEDDGGDGSDFELETVEPSTNSSPQLAAASPMAASPQLQTACAAVSTTDAASCYPRLTARTQLEYSRLPLLDRLCHLQSLLANFLQSIGHAMATTQELVRSNSMLILIKCCCGGIQQTNQTLYETKHPYGPPTPLPPATAAASSSSAEDDSDPGDIDPHSVPHLLHHAQILSLSLLLKLMGSRPCLDVKVCQYLSKIQSLKLLLSVLHPHNFTAHHPATLVDLIAALVQILDDSSTAQSSTHSLSYNLFDEFATLKGYDAILAVGLWIKTLVQMQQAARIQAAATAAASSSAASAAAPSSSSSSSAAVPGSGDDPSDLHDNPFLNPLSLYPCLPARVSVHFSSLSPQLQSQSLSECLSKLLELLHRLIFISPHVLKLPSLADIPQMDQLILGDSSSMLSSEMTPHQPGGASGGGDDHGSPDDDPLSRLRLKNLSALRLLLFGFVKMPLVAWRQEILNRMLLIYSGHHHNIWLLFETHPLTYLIECIPALTNGPPAAPDAASATAADDASVAVPASMDAPQSGLYLQKLVWRLLEYMVNVSNVVPFQEITTIGLVLRVRSAQEFLAADLAEREERARARGEAGRKARPSVSLTPTQSQRRVSLISFESAPSIQSLQSLRTLLQFHVHYPDNSSVLLLLSKLREMIEENAVYRDVFRETELWAIIIQHLSQLSVYLEAVRTKAARDARVGDPTAALNAAAPPQSTRRGSDGSSSRDAHQPSLEELLSLRPLFLSFPVYESALRTIQLLLVSSPANLQMFREFGGSAALFSLLKDALYRPLALRLISTQLDAHNFSEIMEALQSSQTDPELQCSLLHTLIRMLYTKPTVTGPGSGSGSGLSGSGLGGQKWDEDSAPDVHHSSQQSPAGVQASARIKDTYRTLAGFETIFSLLSRMEGAFSAFHDDATNAKQWALLEGILCIIALSISNHPRNREYVWSYSAKNYTWKALAYAIKLSGVLSTNLAPRVIQAVMNIATETPQIPEALFTANAAAAAAKRGAAPNSAAPVFKLHVPPSASQPWVLRYPLSLDAAISGVAPPPLPHSPTSIWAPLHSTDAVLALLRILTDARIDIQVAGLTSLYGLVNQSLDGREQPALRNVESLTQGGVLAYFLAKFGRYLTLGNASNSTAEAQRFANEEAQKEASIEVAALESMSPPVAAGSTLPSLTIAQVILLSRQRAALVQSVVEALASHRLTTAELKLLVTQFHALHNEEQARYDEWRKEQGLPSLASTSACVVPPVPCGVAAKDPAAAQSSAAADSSVSANPPTDSTTLSSSLHLYQLFLRLLRRSQSLSCGHASAADFLEFDTRGRGFACLDLPSFGRGSWPVTGQFAFASWINVRQAGDAGAGVVAAPGSHSALMQLFEFTSGDVHLWSAALLPSGFLLVSAGHITPASRGVSLDSDPNTAVPWRRANLTLLEEKGPGQGQALFEKHRFHTRRWYHIALQHERPVQARSTTGSQRVVFSLYVDGQFVQQVQVQCAPGNATANNASSVMSARGFIGMPQQLPPAVPTPVRGRGATIAVPPSPLSSSSAAASAAASALPHGASPHAPVWWMNGLYFFGGALSPSEIHIMYRRGPGYNGTFQPLSRAGAAAGASGGANSAGLLQSVTARRTNSGMTLQRSGEKAGSSGATGGGVLTPGSRSKPSAFPPSSHRKNAMSQGSLGGSATTATSMAATAWLRQMEFERDFLDARSRFDPRLLDDLAGAGAGAALPGSAPTPGLGGSASSSADSNFFDTDKVVFSFHAHHLWSLREQYTADTQTAASPNMQSMDDSTGLGRRKPAHNSTPSGGGFGASSGATSSGMGGVSGISGGVSAGMSDRAFATLGSDSAALHTVIALAEAADPGLVLPNSSASHARLGFPVAYALGGASSIRPLPIASTLRRIGGVSSLVAMLESEETRTSADVLLLLSVLLASIQHTASNLKEMARIGGYHLVAAILHRKRHLLSIDIMRVLFDCVEGGEQLFALAAEFKLLSAGQELHPLLLSPSMVHQPLVAPILRVIQHSILCYEEHSGYTHVWIYAYEDSDLNPSALRGPDPARTLLANPLALEHWLLNFELWGRASLHAQQMLLSRVQQLCLVGVSRETLCAHYRAHIYPPSIVAHLTQQQQQQQLLINSNGVEMNDVRSWNTGRVRQIGTVASLLQLSLAIDLSPAMLHSILTVLEVLIMDDLPLRDLRTIAAFLVMGLENPSTVREVHHSIKAAAATSFGANCTPVQSGFLARPVDGSVSCSRALLLQLGESLLCILAKLVFQATQSQVQGPQREWCINSLSQVLDVPFFSLFMWADVHPRIITASLHLMSVLVCHSARFRDLFLSPAASPAIALYSASVPAGEQASNANAMPAAAGQPGAASAVGSPNPAPSPTAASVAAAAAAGSSAASSPAPVGSCFTVGFLMLLERLPYARASCEALYILIALMFGRQAFPATSRSPPICRDFQPQALVSRFLDAVAAAAANAATTSPEAQAMIAVGAPSLVRSNTGRNLGAAAAAALSSSASAPVVPPKPPAANQIIHTEVLQVLLATLRSCAADLLAFQDSEPAAGAGGAAVSAMAAPARSFGTLRLSVVDQMPSFNRAGSIVEMLGPPTPTARPLSAAEYIAASAQFSAHSDTLLKFLQHACAVSPSLLAELFGSTCLDKLIDTLFIHLSRMGKHVELGRDLAASVAAARLAMEANPHQQVPEGATLSSAQVQQHAMPVVENALSLLSFMCEYALLHDQSAASSSYSLLAASPAPSPLTLPNSMVSSGTTPPSTSPLLASSASFTISAPMQPAGTLPSSANAPTAAPTTSSMPFGEGVEKLRRVLEAHPVEVSRTQVVSFQAKLIGSLLERVQSIAKQAGGPGELMRKGGPALAIPSIGVSVVSASNPVVASGDAGIVLFHRLHNLLALILWKLENSQLELTSLAKQPGASLANRALEPAALIEFGMLILAMAFGPSVGAAGSGSGAQAGSVSAPATPTKSKLSPAQLDDVRLHLQQLLMYFMSEARATVDHALSIRLLELLFKHASVLMPPSTAGNGAVNPQTRVFVAAVCFHLHHYFLLGEEEMPTSPTAASQAMMKAASSSSPTHAAGSSSRNEQMRVQLCCFSVWHVLLNNHLSILQDVLMYTSPVSQKSYDLIQGGFSYLMIVPTGTDAPSGADVHRCAFNAGAFALQLFRKWLKAHYDDVSAVFDETLFVDHRALMERETRSRAGIRSAMNSMQLELAVERRRKRTKLAERRTALHTARLMSLTALQAAQEDRILKSRREQSYRCYELNHQFLQTGINALHKQSVLFTWANDLMELEQDEAAASGSADGTTTAHGSVVRSTRAETGPRTGLAAASVPNTPSASLPSSFVSSAASSAVAGSSMSHAPASTHPHILNLRVPLPYRAPSVSSSVLRDWIRLGFLPAQRFQLDLTEGPFRQRKKMVAHEEFYMEYKIHVPKLEKTMATLVAKHDGTFVSMSTLASANAAVAGGGTVGQSKPQQPRALSPLAIETDAAVAKDLVAAAAAASSGAGGSPIVSLDSFKAESSAGASSVAHSRKSSSQDDHDVPVAGSRKGSRARKSYPTFDSAGMQELREQSEAQRHLLEELPQLPLSTLTRLTAHSTERAAAAEDGAAAPIRTATPEMAEGRRIRKRQASRRFSAGATAANTLSRVQHEMMEGATSGGEGGEESSFGAPLTTPHLTSESSVPMSPIQEAMSPPLDSLPLPVGRLQSLKLEDSDSSSSEDEDAKPLPMPKPRGASLTPRQGPVSSEQAASMPSPQSALLAAAEDGDATPSSPVERALAPSLTRMRSLATGGSRSTRSPTAGANLESKFEAESPLVSPASSESSASSSSLLASPMSPMVLPPAAGGPVAVELDEYEKILRLLEPGDDVLPGGLYACSRVMGLDKVTAVLVLCSHHLYVIDHFTFSADMQLQSIDPAASEAASSSLFHVAITARPVSAPWHSEDAEGRDVGLGPARADGSRGTTPMQVPPLSAEDVVLRVTKVTASEGFPAPPTNDDPDDPVLEAFSAREVQSPVVKLSYSSLRELHKRRYSLMTIGLELFSFDGVTLLLVFDTPEERDQVHSKLIAICSETSAQTNAQGAAQTSAMGSLSIHSLDSSLGGPGVTAPTHAKLRAWRKGMTDKWLKGEVSNFAYLQWLNGFSGRSYNDLTQYPVFPWILNDYTSSTLALEDERIYRDLSKPMGAIGAERAKLFQSRYNSWEDPSGIIPPFHYGTHYSSAATVLYYLIRLEPFTKYNLSLQGGRFDHSDRLFTSLSSCWNSASSQGGLSDVKELIPEFFFLPEMFRNTNRFDLGEHQRGGYANDVALPPWALGDPRIFVRLHRKALESPYVSANLHHWIDLIFGYKQRGKAAVKATNVFYYLTYEDVVDVNAITDPMEKQATIAQIGNFGQTPTQVFKKPHPARPPNSINQHLRTLTIASHPHLLHPMGSGAPMMSLPKRVACLYWSSKFDKLFALEECKTIVPGSLSKYVSWGHADYSLRFHILQTSPRHRTVDECVAVHEGLHDGQITVVTVTDDGQCLMTGGADGLVRVWRLHAEHKHKQLLLSKTLPAHWAPITAISHAWSYSLLVTGGADGQVLFFDLHKLSLQRRLPIHPFPISCVCIDPYRGDVVTCSGPHLYIWDVNGDLVAEHLGSVAAAETIESVVFTQGAEGAWIDPNIITGHRDGSIRIWRVVYPSASLGPSDSMGSPGFTSPLASAVPNRRRSMAGGNAPGTMSAAELSAAMAAGAAAIAAASTASTPTGTPLLTPSTSFSSTSSGSSSASAAGPATSATGARIHSAAAGSLGQGFLGLELCHRLESAHDGASVTALHTSVSDWRRLWSGDRLGRVVGWQLSQEDHWVKDAEAKNCTTCQVKFSVLERRHPHSLSSSISSAPLPLPPRRLDDAHTHNMAAESVRASDDYDADEFEPEEHKDAAVGGAAAAASYESEPFASASDEDEEEEVFSTPDAHLPPKGLELMQQQRAPASDVASVAPRRQAATAASSAPAAAAQKKSSLPSLSGGSSLGGLPSIGLMSANLTAAGRAHFNSQPVSLFAKPSQSNAAASMASVAPVSTTSDSSISPAALAAYAASNRLHASEYLGIHALQVEPCTSVGELPTGASGSVLELDSGRLRIWSGALEQPDLGSAAAGVSAADAAGFKLPSGVFLRAALTGAAASGAPALHISVDNSDPLASASAVAAASCVSADGAPAAEVPSCFHAHRLGPYRLRIVARGSSMPSTPDSFTEFVTRAAAVGAAGTGGAKDEATTAAAIATAEQSPFDIQPRITLYVAVEKLAVASAPAAASGSAASLAAATSTAALPLLPVGASHTFWLSTHQQSSASASSASGSSSQSQTVLLFADSTDPSNDHLELSLTVQPLHGDILKQLALSEPEMDERDAEPAAVSAAEPASSSTAAAAASSTRKDKKKQKSNAKKQIKKRQAEAESAAASAPLVAVEIAHAPAVPASSSSSTSSEAAPLVVLTIGPASAASSSLAFLSSSAASNGAASNAAPAAPQPSLIDMLATLAVCPSTSLPSSILAAGQSVAQVAQLTSAVSRSSASAAGAASSEASSNASLPSIGASSTASAMAVPSSGVLDPVLLSLDRRVHWPFAVSIDAIRVSDECEGHACVADSLSLDRLHNRAIHKPRAARSSQRKSKSAAESEPLLTLLVGDFEIEFVRTVGLLCAWSGPRDGSALNQPVLVSQQPLLSYHVQCRLTRLDADEANARAMDAVLDL